MGSTLRLVLAAAVAVLVPACGTSDGDTVIQPVASTVTINFISATPADVAPGGSVVFTVGATDSVGGTLSYAWAVPSGSLSASTGNPVTWTAPLTTGTGLIHVTVSSTSGSSAGGVASILVSVGPYGVVVTSVNPGEVSIGDEIRVTGSGFGGTQGGSSLTVSGIAASIVVWSDTLIGAIVPPGASTGAVLVVVGGSQSNPGFIVIVWPTTNPQNLPVCSAASDQLYPRIVKDGSGGAIMVWEDYRSGTSDIYAQRVNSAGVAQWTIDGVAICTATDHQLSPQICSDGSGGAIIVWEDYRSGGVDIYAQRVNGTGVVQWMTDGVVVCQAGNFQGLPQIVSDGSGGAIMVWHDGRSGTSFDIYAQRMNDAGLLQWTIDGVAICTRANDQDVPQIVSDGSGGAIMVWRDFRGGTVDIYAQQVNSAGVVQWTTDGLAICTAVGDQAYPQIVSDESGGAIMAWNDGRSGTSNDIYAQRVSNTGVVQWSIDGAPICTAVGGRVDPQIVSDGSGGVIIVWQENRSGTGDIYAQRVNSSGAMQWTTDGVAICTSANDQGAAKIVLDGSGGAIMVWNDSRSGSDIHIYAQRVNSAGAVQWTTDGVAICTSIDGRGGTQIVLDEWGGAIMVWNDFRSGTNFNIYAQGVSASGLQ